MFWLIYTGNYPDNESEQQKLLRAMPAANGFFSNEFEAHAKTFDASTRLMLPSLCTHARNAIIHAFHSMMAAETHMTSKYEFFLKNLYADDSTATDMVKR